MKLRILTILVCFLTLMLSAQQKFKSFEIKQGDFYFNNEKILIKGGEIHYARVPKEYWQHRFQMIKALGLNTITTYVFWNYHEEQPGVWDFKTDNKNLRAFIKLAAKEGLMVILRPGPYTCAEWDYGGFPWWIQNDKDIVIRTNNAKFLQLTDTYFEKLAAEVADLQITKGGPIIMIQAENEFGSYVAQRKDIPLEQHKAYTTAIKQQLLKHGFDVPLFTSDGSWLFNGGSIEGVLPTANGEDNIEKLKTVVHQYNANTGPYFVAEFYPGWLDHWAEKFVKEDANAILQQTKKYIDNNISFNYYMVHGGTNFGFTSGANYDNKHDLQPDITSYDYDAPISEAGWVTPKYTLLRNYFQTLSNKPLPAIPAPFPVIEITDIKLTKKVSLQSYIEKIQPIENDKPLTFEELNQPHGYVMYSKHFNQPISGQLTITGLRDYAIVLINGEKVGELNRVFNSYTMEIDIPFNATLQILVENLGRINYGPKITENHKGIISPIFINDVEITDNWQMQKIDFNQMPNLDSFPNQYLPNTPLLYEGNFNLKTIGDTFLNMSSWGKGIVFVNGHHLGRYWKVGPQQTLYIPSVWLNQGQNKIVIFEQLNTTEKSLVNTQKTPILEILNP